MHRFDNMTEQEKENKKTKILIGGITGGDEERQEHLDEIKKDLSKNNIGHTQFSSELCVKIKDIDAVVEIVKKHGLYTNHG